MSLDLAAIPSALEPPAKKTYSRVRRAMVTNEFGRRAFLKGAVVGGMAIGIASLDLLPRFGPKAIAAPETWWLCEDYADWNNGLWTICNPCGSGSPYRSTYYCDSSGYHRIDTIVDMPYKYDYHRRPASCKNKNAWRWRIRESPGAPNAVNRICSDGWVRTYHWDNLRAVWVWSSDHMTVCVKYLPMTEAESAVAVTKYNWACDPPRMWPA